MSKSLSAVWLVALVAIFALYVWGVRQDSPEPPRIPASVAGVTPIAATLAVNPVQDVRVTNWQTSTAEATRMPYQSPTPSYPFCPVPTGQVCEVPPPQQTPVPHPTATPPNCDTESMATMNAGTVCRWQAATATAGRDFFK
jgi:hypothetical protein